MKKILFALIGFCTFINLSAQKKDCSYEKNETDKFTKDQILQTEWSKLTPSFSLNGEKLSVSALKINKDCFLLMNFTVVNTVKLKSEITDQDMALYSVYLPVGSDVLVLLEDGNTLKLTTVEEFKGRSSASIVSQSNNFGNRNINYKVFCTVEVKFPLSDENLKILSTKGATSTRLNYKNGENKPMNFDCDFGKKKTSTLKDIIECIL